MLTQTIIRLISICILFILPFFTNAQTITGFVKDASTDEPLIGVNVLIDGTTNGTTTNEKGFYRINVDDFPMVLSFSYIGYGSRKVSVSNSSQESINIKLESVASNLPEAVVSAKPKIDTVYKEGYSVLDYEFFDEYILLLVYRGVRKRYSVLLINNEGEELFEESLGQTSPVGFYKGCLGAVYFLTGSSAFQIYIEKEQIYFYRPVNLTVFEKAAYSCILSADDYVYFQNYYTKGQIIHYHRIHKDDTTNSKESFAYIIDEKRVTMADDSYRHQQMVESMESFALRPMGMGERMSNPGFLSRVVFEPIYAPLFEYKDTLLVFNHRFHQIEYYPKPNLQAKRVTIEYSKDDKWKKEILRDEDTEAFYTICDTRWGYIIKKINVETGTTKDLIELERAFVSNIKVKGGFLYFLENNFRNNDPISKLQKVRIE
ncbi:MAG: carboxypeptidase-like regulatory domain-containing protein [Saprospiraceae bacterium]